MDLAIEEITRIERLISSWDPSSQTSLINENAGIRPVVVDDELFQLVRRSMAISELTNGAFDITYASMDKVWKFDGSMSDLPTEEMIRASVEKVGCRHIVLDDAKRSIFLEKTGMKIGFGAIGKGYAADRAKALLIKKGVQSGIINASGDMSTWGKKPDGDDWKVAITNPLNKEKAFAMLPISSGAVVTSGNYEKFVMIQGKRYAHIIDPRTGYPAQGILSVTVFGPKAELADALSTAVFVMGIDAGIDRINQLPGIECVIIDEQGRIHTSENIQINKI
jgi:thiamine biosynthesis lipoprotein